MAGQKATARLGVDQNVPRRRSPSPSPSRKEAKKEVVKAAVEDTPATVKHNDIFNLPSSDYNVLFLLIVVAVAVRLFRIYQPTSVVFDEVQCVPLVNSRFISCRS